MFRHYTILIGRYDLAMTPLGSADQNCTCLHTIPQSGFAMPPSPQGEGFGAVRSKRLLLEEKLSPKVTDEVEWHYR